MEANDSRDKVGRIYVSDHYAIMLIEKIHNKVKLFHNITIAFEQFLTQWG